MDQTERIIRIRCCDGSGVRGQLLSYRDQNKKLIDLVNCSGLIRIAGDVFIMEKGPTMFVIYSTIKRNLRGS
jgi:hypothetical protein